jgi:hypothetical protein
MTPRIEPPPPENREAEAATLGALLLYPEARPAVAGILSPADFYLEPHQWIYQAILDLGDKADTLTVENLLEERNQLDQAGWDVINRLIDQTPNSLHAEQYAQLVIKEAERRRAIQAAGDIATAAQRGDAGAPLVVARRYIEEARRPAISPAAIGSNTEAPPLPDYATLPEELGACQWLDDYTAFSREWSPRSFDGFHEACGLWLLSTVAARRVVVNYGRPRFTNLYLLLAGRTTLHAKSSATEIARELLRTCGLDYLLAADEATPASFIRAMAGGDLPGNYSELDQGQQDAARLALGFCGQRGWYAEEFGGWLASMVRTDGVMADFRGLLRKFDDCPPDYTRSTIARGTEKIDRPYLALVANLTPADLRPVAKRGTQLWGDGFLARFAFVTPPADEALTTQFPKGRRPMPEDLTGPLLAWHRRLGVPRVEIEEQDSQDGRPGGKLITIEPPEPRECVLTDPAWEALGNYNAALLDLLRESDLHDLDGNYGRLHEKALRVAALLASFDGSDKIELKHWAKGQEVAERWRVYAHRLYTQLTQLDLSQDRESEDKILDAVRRWQGTEKYQDGLTANEIARFVWGLGAGEVKGYADRLAGAGVLNRHKPGRAERYYIPTNGDES